MYSLNYSLRQLEKDREPVAARTSNPGLIVRPKSSFVLRLRAMIKGVDLVHLITRHHHSFRQRLPARRAGR
jgi:hypothetical protein